MSSLLKFKFRLFVAGETPNSMLAISNLNAICGTYLPDRHEIEIVDVFKEPNRALTNNILMTPALIRLAPLPVKQIVGTLSRTEAVLLALGLESKTT